MDGTGIVSHAGVARLRALSDNIALIAGLSRALASDRLLVHDQGRVVADPACAIADGAEVISDIRVLATRRTCWGWSPRRPRWGSGRSRGGRAQDDLLDHHPSSHPPRQLHLDHRPNHRH